MDIDKTHPVSKILRAKDALKASREDLLAKMDELVGYEKEYISILDGLIGMMESAERTHWFKMTGDDSWNTRDRWKLNALAVAEAILKD